MGRECEPRSGVSRLSFRLRRLLDACTILRRLRAAMKRAGIPTECPEGRARGLSRGVHSLRHTHAKIALENGALSLGSLARSDTARSTLRPTSTDTLRLRRRSSRPKLSRAPTAFEGTASRPSAGGFRRPEGLLLTASGRPRRGTVAALRSDNCGGAPSHHAPPALTTNCGRRARSVGQGACRR